MGRLLASLFSQASAFKGRQVATFHNQRAFIFFRRAPHGARGPPAALSGHVTGPQPDRAHQAPSLHLRGEEGQGGGEGGCRRPAPGDRPALHPAATQPAGDCPAQPMLPSCKFLRKVVRRGRLVMGVASVRLLCTQAGVFDRAGDVEWRKKASLKATRRTFAL